MHRKILFAKTSIVWPEHWQALIKLTDLPYSGGADEYRFPTASRPSSPALAKLMDAGYFCRFMINSYTQHLCDVQIYILLVHFTCVHDGG